MTGDEKEVKLLASKAIKREKQMYMVDLGIVVTRRSFNYNYKVLNQKSI